MNYNENGVNGIVMFLPFMSKETLEAIANTEIDRNGLMGITMLLSFIREGRIDDIIKSRF